MRATNAALAQPMPGWADVRHGEAARVRVRPTTPA